MTNDYFNSSSLSRNTQAKAEDINSRTENIAAGFSKIPAPLATAPTSKGFSETFDIEDATDLTHPLAANQDQKQSLVYVEDTGAADAMVVTMSPIPAAYTAGMKVVVKAVAPNTGATTINVNSLGAKAVTSPKGAALAANAIVADMICQLMYDGTSFQLIGDTEAGVDKTISDTAYGAGWDADTNGASKNALYNKISTMLSDTAYDGTTWNAVTDTAPSKNAVRDKIETLAPIASPTFTGGVTVPSIIQCSTVSGIETTNQLQFLGSDVVFVTGGSSAMTISGANAVDVVGVLTAGTKPFKIDHPADPDNKILYHMAIEGPRVDLVYRGVAKLVDGYATVDLNKDSSVPGMMPGTFEALTQNAVVTSLHNQDGFARVRSEAIVGAAFIIVSEDSTSTDEVAWVVMAERADAFIKSVDLTDEDGRFVPERDKEEATLEDLKVLEPEIVETPEQEKADEYVPVTTLNQKKGYRIHDEAFGVDQPTRVRTFKYVKGASNGK